jgi:phenylacetate-CoA ligase
VHPGPVRLPIFTPPRSIEQAFAALHANPASHWEQQGERMVLRLARFMAKTVPAYQSQLQAGGLGEMAIRSMDAFRQLPVLDKATYIQLHEFPSLFSQRDLSAVTTISSTSGSTGEPAYFPRGEAQDACHAYVHELFLAKQFGVDRKRTLGVIGFGLGPWIGGLLTYKTLNGYARKGYRLALAPVGPNVETSLRMIERFGAEYEQVLLSGYPPFVKDVLDEGHRRGMEWKRYALKIWTAAEGFSEDFRDYLAERAHLNNPILDSVNLYGTVELGSMAHETALANLIRRRALEHPGLFRDLFPCATRLPTLAQYHPYLTYFEEVDGEVIASGYGGSIPLVRYRFPDRGGVIPFERMVEVCRAHGFNLRHEARKRGIEHTIMHLPFVYVYERSDQTIILRGANIYTEHVKAALIHRAMHEAVTGKFSMGKREDDRFNGRLEVHVELKEGVAPCVRLTAQVQAIIAQTLTRLSSEFANMAQSCPEAGRPAVVLWPHHHPTYFKPGGKQQWVRR